MTHNEQPRLVLLGAVNWEDVDALQVAGGAGAPLTEKGDGFSHETYGNMLKLHKFIGFIADS